MAGGRKAGAKTFPRIQSVLANPKQDLGSRFASARARCQTLYATYCSLRRALEGSCTGSRMYLFEKGRLGVFGKGSEECATALRSTPTVWPRDNMVWPCRRHKLRRVVYSRSVDPEPPQLSYLRLNQQLVHECRLSFYNLVQ